VAAADDGGECESYTVQLQATFPKNVAIPCTDNEYRIISSLLHALIQTDVIVGMNGMPIPDFALTYETYGSETVKWTSAEESDFTTSQMQLALPFRSIEDDLEDLYYDFDYKGKETTVSTGGKEDRNFTSLETDGLQKGSRNEDKLEKLEKIDDTDFDPIIQPFEDSLRTGPESESKAGNQNSRKLAVNPDLDLTNLYGGKGCDADWCGHFASRDCVHSSSLVDEGLEKESTHRYQQMMLKFLERVATTIKHKLRKWARDTDCMCLGNSWELEALVRKL